MDWRSLHIGMGWRRSPHPPFSHLQPRSPLIIFKTTSSKTHTNDNATRSKYMDNLAAQPGTKGGKTCLISNQNKPIEINLGLGNPLGCPWGASSFDDDSTQTRINLDLTLDDENARPVSANR